MSVATVKLANGTEYGVHWCGCASGAMSIALNDGTVPDLAQTFGDPALTARIEYHSGNTVTTYDRYTQLIAIIDGRWQDSDLVVQLRREG